MCRGEGRLQELYSTGSLGGVRSAGCVACVGVGCVACVGAGCVACVGAGCVACVGAGCVACVGAGCVAGRGAWLARVTWTVLEKNGKNMKFTN